MNLYGVFRWNVLKIFKIKCFIKYNILNFLLQKRLLKKRKKKIDKSTNILCSIIFPLAVHSSIRKRREKKHKIIANRKQTKKLRFNYLCFKNNFFCCVLKKSETDFPICCICFKCRTCMNRSAESFTGSQSWPLTLKT